MTKKMRTDQRAKDYENVVNHKSNQTILGYWVRIQARFAVESEHPFDSAGDRTNSQWLVRACEAVLSERGLYIDWDGREWVLRQKSDGGTGVSS